jgi:hypothetical protein
MEKTKRYSELSESLQWKFVSATPVPGSTGFGCLCTTQDKNQSKTDDPGGRRGNTVQIVAQWWHPVASNVAQDAIHRAMCSILHRRIAKAIETASKKGAFL